MKFLWTTIIVKDMEESIKFYEEVVGLKVVDKISAGPDMNITFLGEGETKIELICSEKLKNMDPGNAVTLGFEVDSLDDMIDFINKRGISIKTGPVQPNPSLKYFIIHDPNGIKIQFAQHLNGK
ncbi:lactoylglutathione lyase [Sedimentibacter acidaminivorans]|jgi:lactoylglutathione lyase|uniref:Lactoylglutathione lyase n=1 Tax=Sedimentibacter acidaminivorans TaxID=913099 RepID=A0ABS4GEH5_9FIRM|nr:VOC family protein [Sedimentibacter acidaminivorans]MBP1926042.1 lactoylglutathione lyase [Sedimentibacter acidaminivorans]